MIHDEFTELNISRQRKWQLRQRMKGRCMRCDKPVVSLKSSFCAKHLVHLREAARQKLGRVRRNLGAKSYQANP